MRRRRSAYYSRSGSYSRSYNAEVAEDEGRLPRSRAARHLGLSLAAFDAGCKAAGYHATEWHHVGKYATQVDYYDCEELVDNPAFWAGAATAYKSEKKQAEVLATMDTRRENARKARVEAFRSRLIAQRDCTRPVKRHNALVRWQQRCRYAHVSTSIPLADVPALAAAMAEQKARMATKAAIMERRAADYVTLKNILLTLTPTRDGYGRDAYTPDGNAVLRPHGKQPSEMQVNVYFRLGGGGRTMRCAEAIEWLRQRGIG